MFERDGSGRRPAFLPATPFYAKPDDLKRGRPRPALHFDEEPVRQIVEAYIDCDGLDSDGVATTEREPRPHVRR